MSKMISDPSCRNAGEVTMREAMVRNESMAAAESLTISEVDVLEEGPSGEEISHRANARQQG